MNPRPGRRGDGEAGPGRQDGGRRSSDAEPRAIAPLGGFFQPRHRRSSPRWRWARSRTGGQAGGQRGPGRSRFFCSGAGKAGCGRSPLRHPLPQPQQQPPPPSGRAGTRRHPLPHPGEPRGGPAAPSPARVSPALAAPAQARSGARGEGSGHPGKGGWVREAASRAGLPRPSGPARGPPPPPPPPSAPAPPRTAPSPGPAPPALPRVRSNGTFSSPLSFRPARNTHTQPQLGPADRPAAAAPLRPAPSSPRSPGAAARPGPGAPGAGSQGYGGLTSYSEVLQRAAAADRRHIDGFQSQHRKPRPIARESVPSRAPARPSRPGPRPSVASSPPLAGPSPPLRGGWRAGRQAAGVRASRCRFGVWGPPAARVSPPSPAAGH